MYVCLYHICLKGVERFGVAKISINLNSVIVKSHGKKQIILKDNMYVMKVEKRN